jgi:hypothetical protein
MSSKVAGIKSIWGLNYQLLWDSISNKYLVLHILLSEY